MPRCALLVVLAVTFAFPAVPQAVDAAESVDALAKILPEPPGWMVWVCGIAVAVAIALRRLRGGGLSE